MQEVVELGIEPEIKEVLDDHKKRLDRHDEDIQELQIDNASFKEQMNSLKTQMSDVKEIVTEFKNSYLQTTNSMMGSLTQVVMNTSNNNTTISTNRNQVILKVLGIVAGLIVAYFAGKGINITI